MSKPRLVTLVGMIFLASLIRLIPHPWNVTPVAAMGLFGGAHFTNKRWAFLVPLTAVLLSDLIIGFYPFWWIVYAAHAVAVMVGIWLQRHKSIPALAGGALTASLSFFLISNLAHFFSSGQYSLNPAGLMECYTAALPFFRNTVLGDLFFTSVLFGSFYLAEKKFTVLQDPALSVA